MRLWINSWKKIQSQTVNWSAGFCEIVTLGPGTVTAY